jgi:O-antigen/teichoic acid export membrane protein
MTASAAPTPPPVNHKRIARNMASNLLSAIIPVIVTFVTVPVYLHHVGAARYGMVMIAWSLIGYFGFMDLGLSRATTNALARIAHHDEVDPKIRVFWSSLIINACLGTIGALLMYGVGYYLIGHVVKVVDDVRLEMLHALPFVSAMLPVSLVLGVGVGTNEAHERFGILNILQTTGSLLGQAGPLVAVLIWGPSLMIIMPTLLVIRVATCSAILAQAMRTAKIPFTPVVDFALLKQLLSFGGWVTVTNLISPIMTDVDQFVIGSLRNVAVVPFYSVPLNMISRVQILPMTLTRTLFPSFSRLGAKDAQDLLRSTTMYLCVVTTVVYLIATFLAQPFLQLWLGADMAAKGGPVMRIFCFGGWANSLESCIIPRCRGRASRAWWRPPICAR